jgi:hypothetical protein
MPAARTRCVHGETMLQMYAHRAHGFAAAAWGTSRGRQGSCDMCTHSLIHWKLVLPEYTLAVGSSLVLTAFAWPYAAHAKGCQEHKMGYQQGLEALAALSLQHEQGSCDMCRHWKLVLQGYTWPRAPCSTSTGMTVRTWRCTVCCCVQQWCINRRQLRQVAPWPMACRLHALTSIGTTDMLAAVFVSRAPHLQVYSPHN